jgi:hypothetical protein
MEQRVDAYDGGAAVPREQERRAEDAAERSDASDDVSDQHRVAGLAQLS